MNSKKLRILGGMFGLEDFAAIPKQKLPWFLQKKPFFLANARSGIFILVDQLKPRRIWMPSYLCGAMISAVKKLKTAVHFFEMDSLLRVSSSDSLSRIRKGDLVVLIDYFGFPYDISFARKAKRRGAWILEDASQALLNAGPSLYADFVILSPRKWIPVPDGGLLIAKHPGKLRLDLFPAPQKWQAQSFQAALGRRDFDHGSHSREWFRLFQDCDRNAPAGPFTMSALSRMLMTQAIDYSAAAQKRRRNYHFLLRHLKPWALLGPLRPGMTPLGFPVRLKNRDQVRKNLFRQEIYPPVHWDLKGVVPKRFSESHRLSKEIMTLPCDQRYNLKDMKRLAGAFLKASPKR